MTSDNRPILISGAGLGGLLLARSLRSNNIPFLLYERDASPAARAQGYRMRISTEGLAALNEVLNKEQFEYFLAGTSLTGGPGVNFIDAITGKRIDHVPGAPSKSSSNDVLGVDRSWLRQCLLSGMEAVVQYGKKATGYTRTSEGVILNFSDRTYSPEGTMLVAADGAHSHITAQLTNGKVRAYDTGARMIHGQTPSSALSSLGPGIWNLRDTTRANGTVGLITNVRPDGGDTNTEIGWVFVGGPGTFSAPNEDFHIVGSTAARISHELTRNWHPKFQAIFAQQNDTEAAFLKMTTADPEGIPVWENDPRVTLLGDAVHCMTPAGGVGANTALHDAALLGRLIKELSGWREDIAGRYEKEMRGYASTNVKISFEAAARQFNLSIEGLR